jgi:hypothetical protein
LFQDYIFKNDVLASALFSIYMIGDIRLLLEEEPDMVTHDEWYENPIFWSVKGYKRMLEQLVREEMEMVHQADVRFRYIMTMGLMPLADTL